MRHFGDFLRNYLTNYPQPNFSTNRFMPGHIIILNFQLLEKLLKIFFRVNFFTAALNYFKMISLIN